MASNRWKQAIVAVALGGATVGLGGVAVHSAAAQQAPSATVAQTTPPTPTPGGDRQARHEQFLTAVAAKLNVTPERLKQAFDEVRQELGLPAGPAGPGHPGGFMRGGMGMGFETAAKTIGITPDQLRQELPGKSLADVAKAHNVDPSTVANALKAEANTHLDQAVSAGRITAERATQIKQSIGDRIDQMINRVGPAGGPPQGGAGGPGMGRWGEHRDSGMGHGGERGGPGMGRFEGGPRL